MSSSKLLYELAPDKKDALEQYPELRDVLQESLRHSAVAPAADQLLRMLHQHRETKAVVEQLEVALSDLEARDRDRLTAARADGRPDPGEDDVQEAKEELGRARRLLGGDERALAEAERHFLGAFAVNRQALDEWLRQETDAVEEEKRRAIQPWRGDMTMEAYDRLTAAAAPYNAKLELLSWAATLFATAPDSVRLGELRTAPGSSDVIVTANESLGGYTFESRSDAADPVDGDVDRARRARRVATRSSA